MVFHCRAWSGLDSGQMRNATIEMAGAGLVEILFVLSLLIPQPDSYIAFLADRVLQHQRAYQHEDLPNGLPDLLVHEFHLVGTPARFFDWISKEELWETTWNKAYPGFFTRARSLFSDCGRFYDEISRSWPFLLGHRTVG